MCANHGDQILLFTCLSCLPVSRPPRFDFGRATKSMTVELSALVAGGSGANWLVDMYDRSTDNWTNIGDLSSAGDDWTPVSLTLQGSDLTIYLDTNFDNEMLVRVYTSNPGGVQVISLVPKPVNQHRQTV